MEAEQQAQEQNLLYDLIATTKADMAKVNSLILEKIGSDARLIPDISNHLISSGGKRLRPMLTLAAARMFGYQGEKHIALATAVEFMHTATLLHDDVVDESDLRRGRFTARKIWGNQASVLVGDFLLGQAFKMMVDVGSLPALDVLSQASALIAQGEVMQLTAAHNIDTKEEEYLKIIHAKTAVLFSAATQVGPIIAEQDENTCQALKEYGTNLGLAFQLVDDALDYGGDVKNLGKNVGDDFREGKITLPIILSVAKASTTEKKFWKEAFEDKKNDDKALSHALELIHKYNALEQTI